jgi:hypothetical protein
MSGKFAIYQDKENIDPNTGRIIGKKLNKQKRTPLQDITLDYLKSNKITKQSNKSQAIISRLNLNIR